MNRIANFYGDSFMEIEKEVNNWLKGTKAKVISISHQVYGSINYGINHYIMILYELEP